MAGLGEKRHYPPSLSNSGISAMAADIPQLNAIFQIQHYHPSLDLESTLAPTLVLHDKISVKVPCCVLGSTPDCGVNGIK